VSERKIRFRVKAKRNDDEDRNDKKGKDQSAEDEIGIMPKSFQWSAIGR
jgi:hypothetical protein